MQSGVNWYVKVTCRAADKWAVKCFVPVFLLFAGSVNATDRLSNGPLQFEKITSIQGLSNNTVYDIDQDSEGYIWFATREGLNRFDGELITSYYYPETSGIPGNRVSQLHSTQKGILFIGTHSGLAMYMKETDSFSTLLYNQNSLGHVRRIIELSNSDVLVATTRGVFRISENLEINMILDLYFRDFYEYQTGIIWALYNDEILVINIEGEIIRRYSGEMPNLDQLDLSSSNLECLYKDSQGTMWFGTKRDGFGYYEQKSDRFYLLQPQQEVNPVEDNFVRAINEDIFGRLWFGTESGLYIYNVDFKTFQFYGKSFIPHEKGLNDKAIYSIFRSKDNLMWIGTYFGGVNYTSLYQSGFHRIYADGGMKGLSGNAVSEIIETSDGKLWIGTEDGGISIFDPEEVSFEYLKHVQGDPRSLTSNNVHALEEDQYGNIWIGTFLGGLNMYNPTSGIVHSIELVPPVEMLVETVYSNSLFSVFIDSKQRTWVGSMRGLYIRTNEEGPFKTWNPGLFSNDFIYDIKEDRSGNIWVCTYNDGIYKIDSTMHVLNYRTNANHDLLSNRIIFCHVDSSDLIWFGSVEGGLVQYNSLKNQFKSYTASHGLPNNTVYAITKDQQGHLWLSTNKGISRFDPVEEKFINYTENDGLIGNQFNFKSGFKSSKGVMYYGAVNGLTYFDPEKLRSDKRRPDVHFTGFKLSNHPVAIGEEDILSSHINFQDEIDLKYKHKVITIDFVAFNYLAPGNTRFAYYLEGLEDDWNYVGHVRSATYTSLSPGKYTFRLKASNGEYLWSESERTLTINMSPPFYLSPISFLLYGILIISSTLVIIRLYHVRQQEKLNVKLVNLEKEKNEEISRHRLNFFTYISHEFKTPLTLILATLEQIMDYDDLLPKFKDYGAVMKKNALRLLFLINQLMDFRKVETDHAAIKFNKGDIVAFVKSTFKTFNPLMKKQAIASTFTSNMESYIVYFDPDKLEKILTNVLSNSCKSLKQDGAITMDLKILEKHHPANPSVHRNITGDLVISIADNGPGLPKETLERIFEPFHPTGSKDIHSSGIGLALVNSLVNYLNGKINISNLSKGGTKVVIQLPLVHNPSPDLIQDDQFIEANSTFILENTTLSIDEDKAEKFDLQDDGTAKEYELLIAEDNVELASFLRRHFNSVFKVHLAHDGSEAFTKIKQINPDMVISDIMMPRMDGYALCNAVKDSFETCHIPVILLTSKTSDESRIEGFYRGADAYVGKPFNLKELDLQIRNILRSRENLKKHFAQLESMQDSIGELSNKDQVFIRNLTDTVKKHLDDSTFDVNTFCEQANVSRTLMHMKLKKITGLSTTEFIKKIRLSEARLMLMDGTYSVSEIAYKVGFNSPAYFSNSFRKMYNHSPSEVSTREAMSKDEHK